ncbi:hypothetical protein CV021_00275 [Staphylococcus aureus]|uniref:Uncharacterized protein n=1 Tax=Staphylococcus aureus TaxID=1280 RepID=A0A7Z1N8Z7_STAAU|nr:hypothetical protein CV021_00275 [Staphylococcus aureus]
MQVVEWLVSSPVAEFHQELDHLIEILPVQGIKQFRDGAMARKILDDGFQRPASASAFQRVGEGHQFTQLFLVWSHVPPAPQ